MSRVYSESPLAARGVVVCAVLLLCPLLYSFSLTSFLYPKAMVLSAGFCLLAVAACLDGVTIGPGLRAYGPLLLGLAVSMVVSTLALPAQVWTRVLEDGAAFATATGVAVLAYPVWRDAAWRWRAGCALTASGVLAALLALAQYQGMAATLFPAFPHYDQRMYSVFGNQDLLGGYLAITLAVSLHGFARDERWRVGAGCALLPILLALMLSGSRSAWLAAAAGAMVLRPWRMPKQPLLVLALCVSLAGIAASAINYRATWGRVFATFGAGDAGGNARLWFWDGTLRMIADAPVFGVGLGNFAYWSPRFLGEALAVPGGNAHYHNQIHTLHAHSAPLELVAETGIAGLFFLLLWLGMLMRRRGPAWGGIAAFAVFCCFNAALHSPPHLLAGLLLAGMLLRPAANDAPAIRGRAVPAAAVLVSILLMAFQAWAVWLPDHRLKAAEDLHLGGGDPLPRYAAALRGRPLDDPWHDGALLLEYGMALSEAGRPGARAVLEAARTRLDTGEVYLLLGEAARTEGDLVSAKAYFRACLFRWPDSPRAFDSLYALAGVPEREKLRTHARRWALTVPRAD